MAHALARPATAPVAAVGLGGGGEEGGQKVLCLFTASKIRIRGVVLTPSFLALVLFQEKVINLLV